MTIMNMNIIKIIEIIINMFTVGKDYKWAEHLRAMSIMIIIKLIIIIKVIIIKIIFIKSIII